MLRPFLAVSMLVAFNAPAFADGGPPGACECATPVPAPAPSFARVGVGLHATSLDTHPEGSDVHTSLGGGGVQLRYRLTPRWELELALDHLDDRAQVAPSMDLATLGVRFHLSPYRRWDAYLLAGIGSARDPDAADTGKPDGQVEVGGGIERRFHHIGLSAELRMITIVPASSSAAATAKMEMATPPPDAQHTVGGGLTLAATYYF